MNTPNTSSVAREGTRPSATDGMVSVQVRDIELRPGQIYFMAGEYMEPGPYRVTGFRETLAGSILIASESTDDDGASMNQPLKYYQSLSIRLIKPLGQNKARAAHAGNAMRAFMRSTGTEDPQAALTELLDDLQHLAYRDLLDFPKALGIGSNMFQDETGGLCHQCGGRFDVHGFCATTDQNRIIPNTCLDCAE